MSASNPKTCVFCKGTGKLPQMSEETRALAERAVAFQQSDTRTEDEKIADGVKFVMGPGDDEGTRQAPLTAQLGAAANKAIDSTVQAQRQSYMPGLRQAEKLLRTNGFVKAAHAVQIQIDVLEMTPSLDVPPSAPSADVPTNLETEEMQDAARGILQILRARRGCTEHDVYMHCKLRGDSVEGLHENDGSYVTEARAAAMIWRAMQRAAPRSASVPLEKVADHVRSYLNKLADDWREAAAQLQRVGKKEDAERHRTMGAWYGNLAMLLPSEIHSLGSPTDSGAKHGSV